MKSHFSGWFDKCEKGYVLGIVSGFGGDPRVALRIRKAADYRLPTFAPHSTKLGHS